MKCRLLVTESLEGATHMALDEAILLLGHLSPTLRFYSWSPPCLSLGYSQEVGRDVDLEACRRLGIALVRRPTGGGAILHHRELTYSLVAPEAHPAISGSIVESYRKVSQGLMAGLAHLGLSPQMAPAAGAGAARSAACFDSASAGEVTVEGRKLAGSAQCRRKGKILQQGSLLLEMDPLQALEVLKAPPGKGHRSWAEGLGVRATCLREALGRPVCFGEVAQALALGFQEALGLELEAGQPSLEEWELAQRLRREKYASPAWTMAR